MTFGEAVRLARRVRGMSQAELARAAGLSHQYLNDIERGRSAGTPHAMVALARVLNLSLDEIFGLGGGGEPGAAAAEEGGE
ncbi:MAG: helix-turn-helix transcriptional regulator [Moorellales bacterium]